MLYARYQSARDAAWRTLLKFKVDRLPVDVEGIAQGLGIAINPWPDKGETPGLLALLPSGAAAASLRIKGKWQVFMKPGLAYSGYRFALAHELGHIILQHDMISPQEGVYAFAGRENAGDMLAEAREDQDTDADMFAIRLLAPACVLHGLHVTGKETIAALCGLPDGAAGMRAERMALLDNRNAYGTHPLEKQVHRQFFSYIYEKRQEQVPSNGSVLYSAPVLPRQEMPEKKKPLPLWVPVAAAAVLIGLGILLFR